MAEQRALNAAHAGMFPNLRRDVAFPVVGVGLLFGAFIAVGLLYQSLFSGAAERLVTIALIDAIIVIGIQIYVGNTGVLSFGHIGFGAIAGYTFAIFAIAPAEKAKRIPDAPFGLTDVDVGSWAAVAVAVAVTVVVAVFVGIGLARSGAESGAVAATVITLALLFVTHEVARHWPEMTGGERAGLSFRIGGALDTRMPIYLALAGALVLARLFAQSRRGRLAKAGREDDLAARAMGVNPMVQQMIALLISVAVVSIGASLRVYETGSILPRTSSQLHPSDPGHADCRGSKQRHRGAVRGGRHDCGTGTGPPTGPGRLRGVRPGTGQRASGLDLPGKSPDGVLRCGHARLHDLEAQGTAQRLGVR